MKRTLLASMLLSGACAAQAACPPAQPQVLLERFVPADCAACWSALPPNPAPDKRALAIDWVVPAPPGTEAPLEAAALLEAAPRAAREGRIDRNEALTRSHPLPAASALEVTAADGPAWNGYIALQLGVRYRATRPLPQGLEGWLALVERIDAGSDGTPVDRLLVRAVAGPLPLDGLARAPAQHVRAVRVPDTGKAERLGVIGWAQAANGRVLAVHRRVPGCDAS